MKIIACMMQTREPIVPFPGTDEARLQGCSCPKKQPGLPAVHFHAFCSVHDVEKVAAS